MAHLTGFGLENFRVFGKETWFDFAPITILTGTNSCGKSNVVKAIVCLNELISSFEIPTNRLPQDFKYEYDFLTKYFGTSSEVFNKSNDEKSFSFKIDSHTNNRAEFKFIFKNKDVVLDSIILSNDCKSYFSVTGLYLDSPETEYYFNFYNTNVEYVYFGLLKSEDVSVRYNIKEFLKNKEKTVYSYKVKSNKFISYGDWVESYSPELRQVFLNDKDYYYDSDFFNDIDDIAILKKLQLLEEEALSNLRFSVQEISGNYVRFHHFGNDENDILDERSALIRNPLFFLMHLIRNKSMNHIKEIKFLNKETAEYFNFLIDNEIYPILDLNNKSAESGFMSLLSKSIIKDLQLIKRRYAGVFGGIHINHFSKNQPKYYYVVSNPDNDFGKMIVDLFFTKSNKHALEFINKYLRIFGLGEKFTYKLNGDIVKLFIKKGKETINIADLGAGITQILTLILKLALHSNPNTNSRKVITFEEPEINLHPALQSKLADMFVDAARTFKIQFIIETHSEYLIRRLQYLTAKKEIKPEDTIIHYLFHPDSEHTKETGEQLRTIRIQQDGRLDKEFGTGFFDESTKLMMSILSGESLN